MTPLANFRAPFRVALGDTPIAGTTVYSNGQIDDILRAVVDMGLGPKCLALTADRQSIAPDPTKYEFGYIVLRAARFALGGDSVVSYKTRALSITASLGDKRDQIGELDRLLHELEDLICLPIGADPAAIEAGKGFALQAHLLTQIWHPADTFVGE